MDKVILTSKQHDSYIHLCGKKGAELEEIVKVDKNFCACCSRLKACLGTHSVPEWESKE